MNVENYLEQCKKNQKRTGKCLIDMLQRDQAYYSEFVKILMKFNDILSNHKMEELIGKFNIIGKYDSETYAQHSSELAFLNYILDNFNNHFIYEPTYESMKNPECSFEYEGKIVNLEVKCPNYEKRNGQLDSSGIKVMFPERFWEKEKIESIRALHGIEVLDLQDNKLKDFLEEAHKKFPAEGDKYFNILVIVLPDISDMDEWYTYLFGCKGVFSNSSFITTDLTNIHAIVLSDLRKNHNLCASNCSRTWSFENTINLFMLNPRIDCNDESSQKFYWGKALDLFGPFTRAYHSYILKVDAASQEAWEKVQNGTLSMEDYNAVYQIGKYALLSSIPRKS